MNKSNLSGLASAFAFATSSFVFTMPFCLAGMRELGSAQWKMVLAAGICSATGVVLFNKMLSQSTASQAGLMTTIMIGVQMCVPAIYYIIVQRSVSLEKAIGLILTFLGVIILSR